MNPAAEAADGQKERTYMDVWLNGAWVPRDKAQVSAFDAGFQHGVGLFETMHARAGKVLRVIDHLARLRESARILRLTESLHIEPLAEVIQQCVERNKFPDARVRLTVSGGDLNLLQSSGARSSHDPTILVVAQPPTQYPPELFANGVTVRIADGRVNPLDPMAGHKTLSYWPRLSALQQAGAAGASEALWFSVTNHLACGCVSNVFLRTGDRLRTPYARGEELPGVLPAPVLPGITRKTIMAIAEQEDIEVTRAMLTVEDVFAADEIFLTNSSWGVLPVVAIGPSAVGSSTPGAMTRQLRAAWLV
ncbi:MAG: aminotransferase class IV [Phycisphaerae bacterium]|nr:aminotransferase class IV [Phycisphaerae bacterium]